MFKPSWIMILALLLLSACGTGSNADSSYSDDLRGAVFSPARTLDDFTIMSTTGEAFTLSEHQGEVVLLYFGYLACPDFCPTTFAELRRVYAELGSPADRLKIVFVTVDPERDSLEALTNYTHAFNADFIGLRPEGEALEAIKSQFGVVAEQRRIGDAPLAYTVDHTASLFLIGPNAQLEAQYLYGTPYEDIVHDLRLILGSLS